MLQKLTHKILKDRLRCIILLYGSEINLYFADLEDSKTWSEINTKAKYSMILAHYLTYELKDDEAVIAKAFDKADDLFKDLEKCLQNHKSFLENNESKIRKGLEKFLVDSNVKVFHDEGFWRLKRG